MSTSDKPGVFDRIKAFFAGLWLNLVNAKEAFLNGEAGKPAIGMGLGALGANIFMREAPRVLKTIRKALD